jgi:hypothetical protein
MMKEDKVQDKPEDASLPQVDSTKTDQPAQPTKPKVKKVWYKNPWLYIGCGALLVGIVSITLGLIYRSNVLKTKQVSSDGWFAITTKADEVVVLQNKLSQTKNYDEYSSSLHGLETTVNDQKYNANKLPTWLTDTSARNRYTSFLDSFASYTGMAAALSDEPSKVSSDDITKLTDSSKAAADATMHFKNNATYVQHDMPQDIFKIPDTLQAITDAISSAQKQTAAQQQAAANATAKDAADKTAVTTSINTFENGFVAGNAGAMRPVMTSGFQNEYNFNQLNPDQRQYQYPASFRVITVEKQTDGTYKADVNVLYKYTDNTNQYTQGYEYSVIYSSGKWLLNNEKQTNSF